MTIGDFLKELKDKKKHIKIISYEGSLEKNYSGKISKSNGLFSLILILDLEEDPLFKKDVKLSKFKNKRTEIPVLGGKEGVYKIIDSDNDKILFESPLTKEYYSNLNGTNLSLEKRMELKESTIIYRENL